MTERILETKFVMNRDVYDAIDLVSEMEGGLLRCTPYFKDRCGCMLGAAHFAGVYGNAENAYDGYERNQHLTPSPLTFDRAHRVLSGIAEAGVRLPWADVAKVMGVVRGRR